ncbi:MAG: 50S ribosomal protein L10 [Actinomycetia bacterium]|nr:50S ribosomal protein L10 [Actinomycetes bacterium]
MPRPEKVQAVADIKERIQGAQAVFLAEYAGLSVKDQQVLRRQLRESGAEFKVVKMTLARRAAGDLDIDSLDELLFGPTGLAFADGDPVGAAKVLKSFANEHDTFVVKGGLLGIEFLSPEKIAELAEIEPREVLLAKLAGVMQAPMAKLAGLLGALPRNTAYALQQLLEQKEQEEPSAEEEPTADSPQPTEGEESSDEAKSGEGEAEADVAEVPDDASDKAEASDSDEDPKTEDEPEVTAEASDDAGEETEDQADEASDDAEEE